MDKGNALALTEAAGLTLPAGVTVKASRLNGGVQFVFTFPNGRGASVINDGYGKQAGLFELAVLDSEGRLDYTTPVTDDVLGWLSAADVDGHLAQIAALPSEVAKVTA